MTIPPTAPSMIRFSKMADYGVLLLGHFARHEGTLASAAELADTYHMPKTVVANLLKSFREAGLLESRRGVSGGYRLVRDPERISLLDVLRVVEGPVQLTDCAVSAVLAACEYEDVCHSRSPMRAVNRRIVELLDGITLAQLINESDPLPASH